MLKLVDRRFVSMGDENLIQTARAMQNNLCPYLLSLEDSSELLNTARSSRRSELERRKAQMEEFHRRDFLATFNFDQLDDAETTQADNDDVEDLSQAMSQLSSQSV